MAMALASASTQKLYLCCSRASSLPTTSKIERRKLHVVCKKKDIHPKYYHKAKVYCEGEVVLVTGGTQQQYEVDVWAGNHPFYLAEKEENFDPFAEREKRAKNPKSQDNMPRGDLDTEVMIGSKIKHIKLKRR